MESGSENITDSLYHKKGENTMVFSGILGVFTVMVAMMTVGGNPILGIILMAVGALLALPMLIEANRHA